MIDQAFKFARLSVLKNTQTHVQHMHTCTATQVQSAELQALYFDYELLKKTHCALRQAWDAIILESHTLRHVLS